MTERDPIVILIADDDEEDRMLAREALEESRLLNEIHCVEDGEQLMDFLHQRGEHSGAPRPGLILLDLKMPRKSGHEALAEIKADPSLKRIPIVILTTSRAERDILESYDLGANSYISKPVTFDGLVEAMGDLQHYWFQIVSLPRGGH